MVIDIKTCDPNSGFEMCIYPQESRRKRASWILWVAADGSGVLYTQRHESGAVEGEPIILGPCVSRRQILESLPEDYNDRPTSKSV